ARRNVFAALAGVVLLLLSAAMFFIVVATRERPPAEAAKPGEQPFPASAATTTAEPVDGARLEASMKACDEEAAKDRDVLHFLVIPLEAIPGIARDWRRVSINQIGNALVLPGNAALEALRQQSLVIAKEPYTFTVRDEATNALLTWDAKTGAQW